MGLSGPDALPRRSRRRVCEGGEDDDRSRFRALRLLSRRDRDGQLRAVAQRAATPVGVMRQLWAPSDVAVGNARAVEREQPQRVAKFRDHSDGA